MNTDNTDNDNTENTDDNPPLPTDRRPLGYWLRVVDGLLTREFATALHAEGVTRRDWMLLNALSGDVDAPGLAERLARRGKRLRGLEERGWAQQHDDGRWELTDAGREARTRIAAIVDGIRSRVVAAVGEEAFATTTASLEAIARDLGWNENDPSERRGFRGRPGFGGPGFGGFGGPGFGGPRFGGPRFGWGPMRPHGFGPERRDLSHEDHDESFSRDAFDDGCRHPDHTYGQGDMGHGPFGSGPFGHRPFGHHGHDGHGQFGHRGHDQFGHHGRRDGRRAQQAYERGFDAGFARGRDAGAA